MSKNKKPLLNEGTVRRMMRLAEIESLSDRFVGETYIEEEENMDLDAADLDAADIEPEMSDEPAEEEAEADEVAVEEDEVTLSDDEARAALDALKAAEPLIDKLEAALGSDEADAEMDAPELDEPEAEEEVEVDMEEPGYRGDYQMQEESEDSLYEAALKGLNIEIVEDAKDASPTAEQLEEVKKAVYKRVVNRLLEDSKTEDK
tara:strand:+ start:6128 stop:6739 length:612 start_codon:yes stop_codon:yes gene_type:complete